jgi:hypothetical protein
LNPYVSFGLAMCAVVLIALVCTAYMAVVFNRRAKADLNSAMTPLAALIDGDVDLEEATARGRYQGHIAEARAANSSEGPGRVFLTSIIDGAGGDAWTYTVSRPKAPDAPNETSSKGFDNDSASSLEATVRDAATSMLSAPGWLRIAYDPVPGHVQLTRPMETRRDIPPAELFQRHLDALVRVAAANRAVQHPEGQ